MAAVARSTAIPAGLARRARIVLLAGAGVPNAEIARRVGVSRPRVIGWRERYLEGEPAAQTSLSTAPTVLDQKTLCSRWMPTLFSLR
jgi:transposase